MTKLYMTVGEYRSNVSTPTNIIGVFETLALAIEMGEACYRAKYICSWYVDEIELNAFGVQEIAMTKHTFDSMGKCVNS